MPEERYAGLAWPPVCAGMEITIPTTHGEDKMIRISLVAYKDGVSAFFDRKNRTRLYHKIGDASIARLQTLGYSLVTDYKATIIPGIASPYVRWAIELKEQSNAS